MTMRCKKKGCSVEFKNNAQYSQHMNIMHRGESYKLLNFKSEKEDKNVLEDSLD